MDNAVTSRVTCYAGSSYPEHPRTIRWNEKDYHVAEEIHRWRTPQGLGFSVRCEPGETLFDLFYDAQEDTWQVQPRGYVIKRNSQPKPTIQGD